MTTSSNCLSDNDVWCDRPGAASLQAGGIFVEETIGFKRQIDKQHH